MKFSIKDSFSKCDQICTFSEDLVTFTEEILNGTFHFLFSVQDYDLNLKLILRKR